MLNSINNRLSGRSSFIEFRDQVVDPINDTQVVEQGELLSDRYFHLVGNDQLLFALMSCLGIVMSYPNHPNPDTIPKLMFSAKGQPDDTAFFSNDLSSLKLLVLLCEEYAHRSNTIFVPEKTKLVAITNN